MPTAAASPGLVHFPALHPTLAPITVPSGVRFLDPGLAPTDDPVLWRPADLPLGADELAGFLREFERLRQEVKNPKDLAILADTSNGHFFTATSFAVREELEDRLHPERVLKRRLVSAQLTLCLTWMVEESLLDLAQSADLETRFREALAESLGLENEVDDEDVAALTASLPVGSLLSGPALAEEFGVPWTRLLSPVWAVLPEGTGLFTADAALVSGWIDAGISLAEPAAEDLAALGEPLPEGTVLVVREKGWRLLGKTRPHPEAPWLDTPRTVLVLQP
ncbi:MAG: hypothetical protein AB7U59_08290 [Desulfovibrionaceae bacterium]